VNAILGRLSDLGLRELFKLLTSAGAEGTLEVESPAGPARVSFREGHVAGDLAPALVLAFATGSGTFCFRPQPVGDAPEWLPQEEFLARLESQVHLASRAAAVAGIAEEHPARTHADDPLAELRESLAEIPLRGSATGVLIVSADPRPYRSLVPRWQQRGWEVVLTDALQWPDGPPPALLIVHLPASGTLAGQGEAWLALVAKARELRPPPAVIWVGGLGDPWIRHQAVMSGVEFMIPAPASEVGETARWFRDEVESLAERLVLRRAPSAEGAAEAFRDFFLALHVDATPAETRASLLRFAGTYFDRGVLFAVRDDAFESVGGYGLSLSAPVRLSRGTSPLEDLVIDRRALPLDDLGTESASALAGALHLNDELDRAELLPVLAGRECVAVFLGDRPLAEASGSETLAAVLARSGGLLDL
jgi:hypothetical protein